MKALQIKSPGQAEATEASDSGVLVTHTLPFSADSYIRAQGLISRREGLRAVLLFPSENKGDPTT